MTKREVNKELLKNYPYMFVRDEAREHIFFNPNYDLKAHHTRFLRDFRKYLALVKRVETRKKKGLYNVFFWTTFKHPFFFPGPSPHPFIVATGLYVGVSNFIEWLWFSPMHGWASFFGFLLMFLGIYGWFRDIIFETSYQERYTSFDYAKINFGFNLFLVSEAMLFVSFFWAFFHSSLAPGIGIGFIWPQKGINPINPWLLPLANTATLLTSGGFLMGLTVLLSIDYPLLPYHEYEKICVLQRTLGRYIEEKYGVTIERWTLPVSFYYKEYENACRKLFYGAFAWKYILGFYRLCIVLGLYFVFLQYYEFRHAPFAINSGIYGSCFFMITGLHGLHVIGGLTFLFVQYWRLVRHHFHNGSWTGIKLAARYWHFVDIIWILVWISVYIWGS